MRTSWGLSTWNNTCFLFKCRVKFRLRQFSKARCGTFGSLHPAFEISCVIEYLWKQLLFLEQNRNFPKRRLVRSRNVSLSSARLDSLVVNKKSALRTCWDLSTWNNTCFLFKCRVTFWLRYFSNATFGTLALYILRLRCLAIRKLREKIAFDFLGNVVFVVLYCLQLFWWFSYKPSEKYCAISPKGKHQLSKMTLSTFQKCLFELGFAFFFGFN